MNTKYEIIDTKSIVHEGQKTIMHRIRSIRRIGYIEAGTIGGWICERSTLNEFDQTWIGQDVIVIRSHLSGVFVQGDVKINDSSITAVNGRIIADKKRKITIDRGRINGDTIDIIGNVALYETRMTHHAKKCDFRLVTLGNSGMNISRCTLGGALEITLFDLGSGNYPGKFRIDNSTVFNTRITVERSGRTKNGVWSINHCNIVDSIIDDLTNHGQVQLRGPHSRKHLDLNDLHLVDARIKRRTDWVTINNLFGLGAPLTLYRGKDGKCWTTYNGKKNSLDMTYALMRMCKDNGFSSPRCIEHLINYIDSVAEEFLQTISD